MDDPVIGVQHRIADDIEAAQVALWIAEGFSALGAYLAKYTAFAVFLGAPDRVILSPDGE